MRCARFVAPAGDKRFRELIVSGGGAKNSTLMSMLAAELTGLKLRTSDEFGLPSEAKEAVAFAVLAYQTWRRRAFQHSRCHRRRAPRHAGQNFVSLAAMAD